MRRLRTIRMGEAGCEDTDRLDLRPEKGNVKENGGKNTGKKMVKW